MKKSKVILTIISLVLVVAMSVAGTLAYLKVSSGPVTNTFSPSNIGLTLDETTNTYKMIPGVEMKKDPKVTVSGDVDAHVFVEVVETGSVTVAGTEYTLDDFLTYAIADGWTVHSGVVDTNDSTNGNETVVLYREVKADAATKTFYVLKAGTKAENANGAVTTNATVTKAMMDACTANTFKLTFTAYAVQADGLSVADAWTEAKAQA